MQTLSDIYKPEALDTRFIPPPSKQTIAIQKASPPRWTAIIKYAYGITCFSTILIMFYTGIRACSSKNPAFSKYSKLLSKGWMNSTVDDTDQQYHGFRSNFFLLVVAMISHTLGRRMLKCEYGSKRTVFDFVVAIVQTYILHGTHCFKVFIILYLNFALAKLFKSKLLSWVFGIVTLFSNELCHGYNFWNSNGGILSNWEVLFKCTVLRMISFSIDYIEAEQSWHDHSKEKENKNENSDSKSDEILDEKERINSPLPPNEYSFAKYFGYALYLPLYLAGPIITYNDFRNQSQKRLPSIDFKRIAIYAFRFVNCFLCLEFILHFIPAPAVTQVKAWRGLTPAQVSMIGWFNLVIIWLKLLIPWRLFRLWSLIDGIDPPENMVRCVANNYSPTMFWRSWHRSFNMFILRYLYFPLNGSKNKLRNSLLVFAFTAIWHDLHLRLFVWGGLAVGFVIPELVCKSLIPEKRFKNCWWYYHLSAIGCVFNIWMLLIANLVGFAVGTDGIGQLLGEMVSTMNGLKFIIFSSFMLYIGVQIMFEIRQAELRRGLDLKC